MKQVHAILFLMVATLGLGCNHSSSTLPTVAMKLGNKTFDIEIARTPDQQETGLMKRDSMPQDHGMIFMFPEERMMPFWMKDTRIPLDIVFLDSSGAIVSIHQMIPYDLHETWSGRPARYAIELNENAARDAGLKVGDHIDIPPEAAAKP